LPGWQGKISEEALEVTFNSSHSTSIQSQRYCVYSSSVLNGGNCFADSYINLHVSPHCIVGVKTPREVFSSYFENQYKDVNIVDRTVGMMTAASMRSCRITASTIEGEKIIVMVTSGLGNLRCAGDQAEYRSLYSSPKKVDTINMLVATTANLSNAAKVEALMIATEAKVAALASLGLMSAVSNRPATGTGTDALAIVSPDYESHENQNTSSVDYVGKHTVFGETLARLVIKALRDSAQYKAR
jgi:iron complex transport system ATP-binding protein